VLVLTAEGEDRILREARRLGAALVTKPFSPTKLSQRIAMMFGDADPDFTDSTDAAQPPPAPKDPAR